LGKAPMASVWRLISLLRRSKIRLSVALRPQRVGVSG
jgi:hypothetical protein